MKPLSGNPRRRRLALLLALTACALQVLGCSLSSLVVCYRADRPPQIEFFAASCSCRQESLHSCGEHEAPGASCLAAACTDVHLGSPAALTATARRHRAPACSSRHSLSPEQSGTRMPGIAPQPAAESCGMAQATAPPVPARMSGGVRLRC
jgi:hypothetical protein